MLVHHDAAPHRWGVGGEDHRTPAQADRVVGCHDDPTLLSRVTADVILLKSAGRPVVRKI